MIHKPYTLKTVTDKTAKPIEVTRKAVARKTVPKELIQPYFPDAELVRAVNVALLLDRPLLVMGEPGCGKSLLAKDIAYSWYADKMYSSDKYFEWNIKSTSKAREGLYFFDYILRLRDANLKLKKAEQLGKYIKQGQLAKAMEKSAAGSKAVLLIDEIDKADIDFSNDLLNELERNSFTIDETKETMVYDEKPFIVITSNSEKDLSDAFLRRCVFHYIDLFSNEKLSTNEPFEWLKRIVIARYYQDNKKEDPMIDRAIQTFITLRQKMNADLLTYRKTVSTSEFLDWFSVLKKCADNPTLSIDMGLQKDFNDWLKGKSGKIPFGNALFKTTKSILDLPTAIK